MNNYIERYIFDTTNRLPEKMRVEVRKELRANIDDMLPEKPTDEDIRKVLIELGSPRKLANGYRNKQRYLISPEWMDDYLKTLKIVFTIFGSIALVFGLIEHIMNPEAVTAFGVVTEVLAKVSSDVFDSLFRSFAVVTLIFAAIEASSIKNKACETWTPDSLPQLPKENVVKIDRIESIIGLIITIVFGSAFIYWVMNGSMVVSWMTDESGTHMSSYAFFGAAAQRFIPFFVATLVLDASVYVAKLVSKHWNFLVAALHTVEAMLSFALFIVFIAQPDLLNPTFIAEIHTILGNSTADLMALAADGIKGLTIFIGIMVSIDLISTWVKTLKGRTKESK